MARRQTSFVVYRTINTVNGKSYEAAHRRWDAERAICQAQ